MTLPELVAWLIHTWQHGVAVMERSEHAHLRARAVTFAAELITLRHVSAALRNGTAMSPELVIWRDWLLAILPTYQNAPYVNEAANTARRQAALVERDNRLAKGRAA